MEDKEILDYLKECKDLVEETLDRVDALEDLVYNKVLKPAEELENEYNTGKRRDEFKSKFGEQLSAFNDKLRAVEGDDSFDLADKAFSDYDALEEKPEADAYVAKLIDKVKDQLEKISKAFGNSEVEAKLEKEEDGSDHVDVEADTDGDGVAENEETVATTEEEINDNDEAEDAAEEIDSPEDIEKFEKELEEELKSN